MLKHDSSGYFTTGAGAAVLERDAALARADRYRARLARCDEAIRTAEKELRFWAETSRRAHAVRERIVRGLSEAEWTAAGLPGTPPALEPSEPAEGRSAGWTREGAPVEEPILRLCDLVPGGRIISKPQPY
jgi:hypothetical protein